MYRLMNSRRRRRSRGQGITEFALVAPLLLVFLLITIDFGRLFMSYVTLNNVTRVAANYGSTNPTAFAGGTTSTNYTNLVGHESAGLNCVLQGSGGLNPPIPTFPTGTGLGGTSVATMSCDFSLLTPFVTQFFGGPLTMSAKAEFPIRTGAIQNVSGGTTLPPPGSPVAAFDFTGVSGGTIDGSGNVTGMDPVTVNVTEASQNAQTWDWDWGDGILPTADQSLPVPNPHTFSSPGTYTVRLTVTNTVGSSTRTRTVTVSAPPTPNPVAGFYGTPNGGGYMTGGGATGTPITGTYGLNVNFTNQSTNGTSYDWIFGDGGTSTNTSPSRQYNALGIFTVTLNITQPTGGTPSTRTNYVTIGCVVPNFANTSTSATAGTWAAAHFTGSIRYKASNANANSPGNPNPPGLPKNIVSQDLVGGDFTPPAPQGNSYRCDSDITVTYTP
jgi:PKD repeat protein